MNRLWLAMACLALTPAWGQKKPDQFVELHREMANLDERIRAVEEKFKPLEDSLKQLTDLAVKNNNMLVTLERNLREAMAESEKRSVAPVAGLNGRIDEVARNLTTAAEAVSETNARMGKLQDQVKDVDGLVRQILANPAGAAAPPPVTADPGAAPPPGVAAKDLYDNAARDRSTGNLDMALEGFENYLKYFPTTDNAPSARYNVGQIFYDKGDFEKAAQNFDMVLERYSENQKTPDALYMKGMCLFKLGKKTEAGQEFLHVIERYPDKEVASKAKQMRKGMGLNNPGDIPARAPAKPKAQARRRKKQ